MAQPVTAAELRAKPVPGSVDPNVKIPAAILAAGKRSEELQRASLGIAEPSVAEATVKAAAGDGEPTPPPTGDPPPSPAGDPPPAAPVTPPGNGLEAEPQPGEPVDWERRFKSLSGRVEAQSKRDKDAITMLTDRLAQMDRELQAARTAAPPPAPAQPQSLLTEQEINDYGPELVDVMRRVAAETAGPLNAEIQRLRAGLGHVQAETGNAFLNRMNSTIGAAVPNWGALNKDQRFIEWSALPDIFSGAIRKELMQEAWNSGDANRVIAFFRAFLAEEAALHPPGSNGQARTVPRTVVGDQSILPQPSAAPAPGLDLTTLAAPGRAHSAGGSPAEKPVYTTAEITKFYTDVASGRWRGREAQQAAIDADIILAQREGRIILNPRTQLPVDKRLT